MYHNLECFTDSMLYWKLKKYHGNRQFFYKQNKNDHTFIMHIHGFQQILSDGMLSFETHSVNIWRSIVTWESGKVYTCDSFQQPSSLQREWRKEYSISVYASKAKLT